LDGFLPDACLINRYQPGAKLSLHQDRNEKDLDQPIVSVSLGIPATFLLGGLARSERAEKLELLHGDVLVWGGPDRLALSRRYASEGRRACLAGQLPNQSHLPEGG
jgi:alkylated DNA repair protein (DNA oxidative demethylase)